MSRQLLSSNSNKMFVDKRCVRHTKKVLEMGVTFHFSLRSTTKLNKFEYDDLARNDTSFCVTKKKNVNNIGSTTKFSLEVCTRTSTSPVHPEPEFL